MQNIYEQVDSNKTKSTLIVTLFIGFVITAVYLMLTAFGADYYTVVFALIVAIASAFASYYFSDRIVLSLSGAHKVTRDEYFDFFTVTENLALAAGLPLPELYVIEDTALNAFATGRDPNHAVVVATTGLLSRLERSELEGVIAHELSHIRNYDIRLMAVVAVLVGSLTLLADWLIRMSWFRGRDRDNNHNAILGLIGLVLVLLSPLIANLIKLAISRQREFLADASGAALTKYPEGLASALEKISADQEPLEAANKATAHLYISDPLKNRHDSIGWFANLFATHPPVEDRIRALRQIG